MRAFSLFGGHSTAAFRLTFCVSEVSYDATNLMA